MEITPRPGGTATYTQIVPVSCSNCGTSNADGARFCSQCGTSLAVACPSCGTEASPDARFCSSCGADLGAAGDDVALPGEERKVVSVVFCDLAGFTAHTERSDPEDVRARLTTYHVRVRQDVERFGGRVEKLMGDGVFAVFGAPVAHEDDPERAVRAALRVQESVTELNDSQPDLALIVRAAVTTGEAIVQLDDRPDREGIVGDVVNTASRLEAVAEPGSVVVDERTYLATRGTIDFAALDPVVLKGKAESVPIWRAAGARSRYGVAVDEEAATPFVGRSEEISLLVDAFERTMARSTPQLVTITGEPGVGKSRLIREFRRAIDDRTDLAFWRQGRCLPYGEGVTFWAIGELVKAHVGILESEPPEASAAKLEQAVSALIEDQQDAAWVALRLQPLTGAGSAEGAERQELFAAWLRFFEALAARNPLIIVIEDLHWADDAVIEFLDHLLEWAAGSPILLVATARPELFTDRPTWGAGRRDAVTSTLAPLSSDEAASLMVALTDRPAMPADLQQTLLDRSGGNPLYVTEYVRLAEEQGWFTEAEYGEDLPLPDSIQAIISARVDLLSPEDKTLLQTAAVVGRVFWAGALSFADAGSPEEVREGLRRLARRELVRPVRRSSMQGQEEYAFNHILIRDVAYGRLTRDERARLHEATARWLEAVSGDRAADVAELLAHHLATAFELAPFEDPDRRRRIHRFLLLAAERAAAFDVARARDYAKKAQVFATSEVERGRALIDYGQFMLHSTSEAEEMFTQAIACFAASGDREGEAEATMHLSRLEWYRGNAERVDALDARTLELIEGLPPSPLVARMIISVAGKRQLRGREEAALDLVERGIAIAREFGDTEGYARGLVIRGSALTQMGVLDAISDVEEALRIELDRGKAMSAMRTYNNLATFMISTGDALAGLEVIEDAIDYGTQRGLVGEVDWSQLTRCEALYPLGRWDELDAVVASYREDEQIKETQTSVGLASFGALVDFHRGDVSAAWRTWQTVVAAGHEVQDPQILVPALGLGTMIAAAAGDRATAQSLADEFVSFALDHPVFLTGFLLQASAPMIELGMADSVSRLLQAADDSGEWSKALLNGVAAKLAAADGRHAEALELWTELIVAADQRALVLPATEARINAVPSALALGHDDDAAAMLNAATEAADALRAERLLDQIESLRAGGRTATGA
jgi:class 3 adenylate cyclase